MVQKVFLLLFTGRLARTRSNSRNTTALDAQDKNVEINWNESAASINSPSHVKTLPLPFGETDGAETWKEQGISAGSQSRMWKPLQKPAHSDLCNWCLSQRRAIAPASSRDQALQRKKKNKTRALVELGMQGMERADSGQWICPSQNLGLSLCH